MQLEKAQQNNTFTIKFLYFNLLATKIVHLYKSNEIFRQNKIVSLFFFISAKYTRKWIKKKKLKYFCYFKIQRIIFHLAPVFKPLNNFYNEISKFIVIFHSNCHSNELESIIDAFLYNICKEFGKKSPIFKTYI